MGQDSLLGVGWQAESMEPSAAREHLGVRPARGGGCGRLSGGSCAIGAEGYRSKPRRAANGSTSVWWASGAADGYGAALCPKWGWRRGGEEKIFRTLKSVPCIYLLKSFAEFRCGGQEYDYVIQLSWQSDI